MPGSDNNEPSSFPYRDAQQKVSVLLPDKELAEAYVLAQKQTSDKLVLKFKNSAPYFADALCKVVVFLGQSQALFRNQLLSNSKSQEVGLELLRIVMLRIQESGPPGKLEELQSTYQGKDAARELIKAYLATEPSGPPMELEKNDPPTSVPGIM